MARKSAFDFEGGEEVGDFYGLGADLAEEGAPASEKTAAFNELWDSKYKGQTDWEGKKYTSSDKAKARKAMNAGWKDERSGGLSAPSGKALKKVDTAILVAVGALALWYFFIREKK